MMLKLVACTKIYKNLGNSDLSLWRVIGGNEYIVDRFEDAPDWLVVGRSITKFIHVLEGKIQEDVKEVYSGFELYPDESLTHNEFFQLDQCGTVDFPAEDITKIDVSEEMDGIKGL